MDWQIKEGFPQTVHVPGVTFPSRKVTLLFGHRRSHEVRERYTLIANNLVYAIVISDGHVGEMGTQKTCPTS